MSVRWWTAAGRLPWWWGRKWWWPLFYWWYDQQPPFGLCIDCEATGLSALRFFSLVPGRVEGRPLTGAGTCLQCAQLSPTQSL